MPVPEQTPVATFTGNGVTTDFSFTWGASAAAHVVVEVDDVELVSGVDFSVLSIGDGGGTVRITPAPALDAAIAVFRRTPLERVDIDYQEGGPFKAETVDLDFNTLWRAVQEIGYSVSLVPQLPPGSPLAGTVRFPPPGAGHFLRWNTAGDALEAVDVETAASVSTLRADLADPDGASLVAFRQPLPGAAARTVQLKLGDVVSIEDYGAVGDGIADDTEALLAAIATGKRIVCPRGKSYRYTTTITINIGHVDFGGATLVYDGPKNAFALVINNPGGVAGATDVRNFLLRCTDTDTVNRTHGLCLGGSCGKLDGARIEGFTGISFAMGSGAEAHTGVTLAGSQQCYYWDVASVAVASTSGWNFVIPASNNANHFRSLSAFPYGSGATPRPANCIDELVIGGTGNTFDRVSLEASPSNRVALFLPTSNGNQILGVAYVEFNPAWATPPFPRVEAQPLSSGNRMSMRHPYASIAAISDLGTANDLRALPSYYINGAQEVPPSAGVNMIQNGRFENGSTGWSNFSVGSTLSYVAGFLSGKAMRVDVVAGRPNVAQDLVAVGGYSLDGLRGQNITVSGYVRTNLPDASIKAAGLTQGRVRSDGVAQYFVATVKVPTAASAVSVALITESSNLTGYVEWSDVTAVIGNQPLALGPREPLIGSATYNPPNIAAGAQASTTVTVVGAALGDYAVASFGLDLQGVELAAYVSAADIVTVLFKNGSAGPIDLGSGTLRVRVTKV